ncbi:MAG: adenylosuccinate lyase [Nitrososphaerota archaeon]|nr:adenylosuccinate lyase [Nitrososphaerota archaeon]
MSSDAVSPADGRYGEETSPLARYFSERALTGERVRVELAYLRFLVRAGVAPKSRVPDLVPSVEKIKKLEQDLGHDVKAVEVYIRNELLVSNRSLAPFVHLGLTSEDTNSLAYAVLLKGAMAKVLVPEYSSLALRLAVLARKEAASEMAARTHGRPAVPTTFGKEVAVFAVRIAERVGVLGRLAPMAKFSGAVGTYASFGLLGKRDWPAELADFVSSFGVEPAAYSTQVVPGERLSDILHSVINLNQLMVSLARDLWLYQTLDLVRFLRPGKVSSSTMPQKVNPVDVENAEGQAEISNAILTFLAYRLQVTRLQRDLSDSVIRRMVGQGLAHSLVAAKRLQLSLRSMEVDRAAMKADLERHPEVYAEREQIVRRLEGDEMGYEKVKEAIEKGRFGPVARKRGAYLGEATRLAEDCPAVVKRLLKPSS